MYSLSHYALLGSLIAAAAGALVLAIVTFTHGPKRRETTDTARLRLADTAAVLCFAVAAALGVLGVMHPPPATPALAAGDDSGLTERLQALEKRLASAELELQARTAAATTEWGTWDERLTRLESRVHAVEQRATAALRRAEPPPVPASTERNSMPQPRPVSSLPTSPVPSASPAPMPEVVAAPEVTKSPPPLSSAPIVAPSPPAPREAVQARAEPSVRPNPPARVEPPVDDPSLGAKLRRDWDEIKRQARRSGDDWREGWDQLKRLFSD
jgi:hypothetical protein